MQKISLSFTSYVVQLLVVTDHCTNVDCNRVTRDRIHTSTTLGQTNELLVSLGTVAVKSW